MGARMHAHANTNGPSMSVFGIAGRIGRSASLQIDHSDDSVGGGEKSRDKKGERSLSGRQCLTHTASLRGDSRTRWSSPASTATVPSLGRKESGVTARSRPSSECHLSENQFHDSFKRARLTSGQSCSVFGTTVCTA